MLHNVCGEFTYDDFGPDSLLVHDGRGFDAVAHRLAASAFGGDAPAAAANGAGAAPAGAASAGVAPGGRRARLVLGTTVTSVEAAGATDAPLAVRSRDGRTRLARRVVVTASVGVLQSELLAFTPPLPATMRAALGGMRMAGYAKLFVEW